MIRWRKKCEPTNFEVLEGDLYVVSCHNLLKTHSGAHHVKHEHNNITYELFTRVPNETNLHNQKQPKSWTDQLRCTCTGYLGLLATHSSRSLQTELKINLTRPEVHTNTTFKWWIRKENITLCWVLIHIVVHSERFTPDFILDLLCTIIQEVILSPVLKNEHI